MALNAVPKSDAAKTLVRGLTASIRTVVDPCNQNKLESAVGAVLADLLASYREDAEQWSYRPTGSGDFTDLPVGYRPFKAAREGFQRLHWVDYKPGLYRKWGGETSRCRANALLLSIVEEAGITPKGWNEHFGFRPRSVRVNKPILLRAERQQRFGELRGKSMAVDRHHPKVIAAREQVERINAYFAKVEIERLRNAELPDAIAFRTERNEGRLDDPDALIAFFFALGPC